ncbi:hypothetical protein Barb4_02525 [Bacteroidales bacterium Barb4]|nr:hypothetical protein Barb4_02525 [Bacteroidales bacterium Barb4]
MQHSGMWGNAKLMCGECRGNVALHKCPERAKDFSPTCSKECGGMRGLMCEGM